MNYTEQLKKQKQQLKLALEYAEIIEDCDWKIERGQNYFKGVRQDAINNYADAVAAIVEQSVEISAEFQKPKVNVNDFANSIFGQVKTA